MVAEFSNFNEFFRIRDDDSKGGMRKPAPTWAVVATVDEPPALVQAFVAWYLSLGAAQVFLYCDRPDDPVQPMLAHLARVIVVPCDAAHWLRLGKSRPRRHEVRQVRNAQDADARASTDWILHCDADEFVWPGRPVADVLGGVLPDTDCLVLPVAERVQGPDGPGASIFAGAFRRPFRERDAKGRQLFGRDYDLTYRGLTGHAQGKAVVRRGRSLRMSIHRPRPARKGEEIATERAEVDALELLHFEGLTPAHWDFKLARMVHTLAEKDGMPPSNHRRRQADELVTDPTGGAELYQRLKCPDEDTLEVLRRSGLWTAPAFDIAVVIEQCFPNQTVDLTPGAIDAWLRKERVTVANHLLLSK